MHLCEQKGVSGRRVARELGIRDSIVSRRRSELGQVARDAATGTGAVAIPAAEIRRL